VLRRLLREKSIFSADRLHIHHRLLERGLAPRNVVLVLYGAAVVGAGIALLSTVLKNSYAGFVLLLFCGVTWYGIKNVGYQEINLARRIAPLTTFRQILRSQAILQTAREHLNAADTPAAYWKVVRTTVSELGFCGVGMTRDGVTLFEAFDKSDSVPSWTITIPFGDGGHVELAHRFEEPVSAMTLTALIELLRSGTTLHTEQKPGAQTVEAAALRPLRKAASG